ncbi:MAG: DUF5723 family protein, partial [Marinirhabdus sp.]|nr:DUF5723 family protein [Marinirhabdus sp.]
MKIILTCLLVTSATIAFSQNRQILYGMSDVPQSLMLNPGAKVPQQKHYGIPFLSQFHLSAGAKGVTAYDIFKDDGEDVNAKITRAIFQLSNTDYFTANQQLEIISFGWRNKRGVYFSGGIYEEFDFITYFPRDLAILAWEGNRDYLDYPFDLGELNVTADLLTVYHFGANTQISDKLTIGARAKVYSSMASVSSTDNRGTFTTSFDDDGVNVYDQTIEDAYVKVQTSGVASFSEKEGFGEMSKALIKRGVFGGNLGLGIDLGVTYDISRQVKATASVIDLGFIYHNKDVETYRAEGDYNLNGIELIFPPLSEGNATIPYYDNLEEELEREIPIDTITKGYVRMRPLQTNVALEYGFGSVFGGEVCDCTNKGSVADWAQ